MQLKNTSTFNFEPSQSKDQNCHLENELIFAIIDSINE